jgi:myo-inositol-1(or 4)-monophosphatase
MSGMTGARLDIGGPHLLADNGAVHQEVLTLFAEVFRGEYRWPMPVIA